jgi:hypothetical protein
LQSGRRIKMATNNNGNLLDDAGNVVVDFVWGNFPLQPNDQRPDTATGRLDFALDNHVIAQVGWNGYPLYVENTDGSAVDSDSPADGIQGDEIFLKVPTVIGLTTALAVDALKDAGFATVATATAATNAASTITAVSRTGTTATVTSSGAGAKYPVGTKITIASLVSPDTALNGTWTVTATATNTVSFTTTTSGALSTTGLTVAGLTGVAGTIKSVAYTSGTAANQTTASIVTVTPFAAAS